MIVGRCSEIVLKDNPHPISIFVLGDREAKIERVMRIYELMPVMRKSARSRRTVAESLTTIAIVR